MKGSDDYNKYISYIDDRPFNDKRYYISNIKLKELLLVPIKVSLVPVKKQLIK